MIILPFGLKVPAFRIKFPAIPQLATVVISFCITNVSIGVVKFNALAPVPSLLLHQLITVSASSDVVAGLEYHICGVSIAINVNGTGLPTQLALLVTVTDPLY